MNLEGSTQANDRTELLPDGQSRPCRQSLKTGIVSTLMPTNVNPWNSENVARSPFNPESVFGNRLLDQGKRNYSPSFIVRLPR